MPEPSRVADSRAGRRDFLVFGKPSIGDAEIAEVVDSLRSGWVGTGPKVARFERALGEYVRAPHVRCLSSCTASLYLALKVAGVTSGDEVITPAMTFLATPNAVEHIGATPVLVDVEPGTGLIDLAAAEASVTSRTRAVIPVHMAGRPVDLDALGAFAAHHGLTVIEDAAHAIGAEWAGRRVGAHGNLVAFSFYANKNVSTGEGGALVCPSAAMAERVRRLARQGLSEDAWSQFSRHGHVLPELEEPGFKHNMTDLQAALGLHQLSRLDASIECRASQWQEYDDALEPLPLTLPLQPAPGTRHARHLYQVLLDPLAPLTRDQLSQSLRERGIGTGVHYRAVHLHRYYRERYAIDPGSLPVATDISERTLSLPIGPGVTDDDLAYVIAALHDELG
jgi:dTDP-4-amino-4,6-dideoxygalactose transaminase